MQDLIERMDEDRTRLTVAVAQGFGISMSSEYASKWQADHLAPSAPAATPDAIQRQAGSIARLAGLFPGAVKQRVVN